MLLSATSSTHESTDTSKCAYQMVFVPNGRVCDRKHRLEIHFVIYISVQILAIMCPPKHAPGTRLDLQIGHNYEGKRKRIKLASLPCLLVTSATCVHGCILALMKLSNCTLYVTLMSGHDFNGRRRCSHTYVSCAESARPFS
jgi:hypothetical protein